MGFAQIGGKGNEGVDEHRLRLRFRFGLRHYGEDRSLMSVLCFGPVGRLLCTDVAANSASVCCVVVRARGFAALKAVQ